MALQKQSHGVDGISCSAATDETLLIAFEGEKTMQPSIQHPFKNVHGMLRQLNWMIFGAFSDIPLAFPNRNCDAPRLDLCSNSYLDDLVEQTCENDKALSIEQLPYLSWDAIRSS